MNEEDFWSDETGKMVYTFQLTDSRLLYIATNMVGWDNLHEHPRLKFEIERRGIAKPMELPAVCIRDDS